MKNPVYTEDRDWKNNTFVRIYECKTEKIPSINRSEIQEGKFYNIEEVIQIYKQNAGLFVPGFKQTFPLYLKAKHYDEQFLEF